jgi:hypothetical protein
MGAVPVRDGLSKEESLNDDGGWETGGDEEDSEEGKAGSWYRDEMGACVSRRETESVDWSEVVEALARFIGEMELRRDIVLGLMGVWSSSSQSLEPSSSIPWLISLTVSSDTTISLSRACLPCSMRARSRSPIQSIESSPSSSSSEARATGSRTLMNDFLGVIWWAIALERRLLVDALAIGVFRVRAVWVLRGLGRTERRLDLWFKLECPDPESLGPGAGGRC